MANGLGTTAAEQAGCAASPAMTQNRTRSQDAGVVDDEALLAVAHEALGPGVNKVAEIRRMTGGASRETWSFDAREGSGRVRTLILQIERPGAVNGGGTMTVEAAVQRAARSAGVPVPEVVWESTGSPIGRPFLLLERLEGETIPRRILRAPELASARTQFAEQAGATLARIHDLDPAVVTGIEAGDQLDRYARLLQELPASYPALELGLRWLERYRPAVDRNVVLHGDFRMGNLLFDRSGIAGVLDWELCHLGDPAEDLAWLCLKAWRFGSTLPVAGLSSRDALYSTYERASGRTVDPFRIHWWEVFGNVKWAVICALQAQAHRGGLVRSVELLSLGRKVCEIEHELLGLLV